MRLVETQKPANLRALITRCEGSGLLDRFGKAAAHRAKNKRRNFPFGHQREIGGLPGKFPSPVKPETGFAEKLCGKTHVLGAVHAPKPEFLFMALQEVEGLFDLFHGAIEGRRQEKDAKNPGVTRIGRLNPNAIFAVLIAFHAATIVIANCRRACPHSIHLS